MKTEDVTFQVSYSDTDQMGFMHHANYLKYYEKARWDLFADMDLPYKEIEEQGHIFPVIECKINYLYPAFYDDVIRIKTEVVSVKGARIQFQNKMYKEDGTLINEALIAVACVNKTTQKATMIPVDMKCKLDACLMEVRELLS
jgi:acyl-CoA thioester hydrolase